jgi:hypothetical protein
VAMMHVKDESVGMGRERRNSDVWLVERRMM